jgi:hypothetical protein
MASTSLAQPEDLVKCLCWPCIEGKAGFKNGFPLNAFVALIWALEYGPIRASTMR